MIHLSASSLWRAEKCPASASLPQIDYLTAAREEGSEMHAEKERENPEGAEVAYAFDVLTGKARELGRRLGRAYGQLAETEIAGTADKMIVERERVVIRDYKSGHGFNVPAPKKNIQLGFYAVAACAVEGKDAARVELEFTDRGDSPGDDLDAFDLAAIRARIRAIWDAATAKEPKVVVGDNCSGCPAIRNCPAHLTMAIAFSEGLWPGVFPTDGLTVEKVAQGWDFLDRAYRVLGLAKKTYLAFASLVPVQLQNGKLLGPHEVQREELDGVVTYQMLRDLHGENVARAAVSMETSKNALEEALKPVAAKGKRAGMVREALQAIRDANGVVVKRSVRVEEHQPKENDNGVG